MEHMALPSHPIHAPVEVPLFCSKEYDGKSFLGYPEREGWQRSVDYLSQSPGALGSVDPSRLTDFLQRWLFFGLLESFLGGEVRREDFSVCKQEPSRIIICTTALNGHLRRFKKQEKLRTQDSEARYRERQQCLDKARDVLYGLPRDGAIDGAVLLSISILYESLAAVNLLIFATNRQYSAPSLVQAGANLLTQLTDSESREYLPELIKDQIESLLLQFQIGHENNKSISRTDLQLRIGEIAVKHESPAVGLIGIMSPVVKARLMQDGWCPHEIRMLTQKFNASGQFYASHLSRPGKDKNHKMRGCSSLECRAYKTEEKTYETRHISSGDKCRCEHVPVDQNKIQKSLKEGNVPAIQIIKSPNDGPWIDVVPTKPHMPYLAVSHVWSDGMGNPFGNSLPKCLLNWLSGCFDLMKMASTPIWIDTLCCPIAPPKATHAAIALMRKTYADASCVLVIDAWLREHNTGQASAMETMMKFVLCGWTRRLWTFQEGGLNRKVYVWFADGIVNIDAIVQAIPLSEDLGGLPLERTLIEYHSEIRSLVLQQDNVRNKMRALTSSFKYRSTSEPTDEPLCLGVVFSLDVGKIWKERPEARMAAFWEDLHDIPAEVIFWDSAKLEQEGFRWAPRTLFGNKQNLCLTAIQKAELPSTTLTKKGLVVRLSGFIFPPELADLVANNRSKKLQYQDQDGQGYWFSCLTPLAYSAEKIEDSSEWPAVVYSERPIVHASSESLGLILQGFPVHSPAILLSPAVLVIISDPQDNVDADTITVRFVCYGLVCMTREPRLNGQVVQRLDNQLWCVD